MHCWKEMQAYWVLQRTWNSPSSSKVTIISNRGCRMKQRAASDWLTLFCYFWCLLNKRKSPEPVIEPRKVSPKYKFSPKCTYLFSIHPQVSSHGWCLGLKVSANLFTPMRLIDPFLLMKNTLVTLSPQPIQVPGKSKQPRGALYPFLPEKAKWSQVGYRDLGY